MIVHISYDRGLLNRGVFASIITQEDVTIRQVSVKSRGQIGRRIVQDHTDT